MGQASRNDDKQAKQVEKEWRVERQVGREGEEREMRVSEEEKVKKGKKPKE